MSTFKIDLEAVTKARTAYAEIVAKKQFDGNVEKALNYIENHIGQSYYQGDSDKLLITLTGFPEYHLSVIEDIARKGDKSYFQPGSTIRVVSTLSDGTRTRSKEWSLGRVMGSDLQITAMCHKFYREHGWDGLFGIDMPYIPLLPKDINFTMLANSLVEILGHNKLSGIEPFLENGVIEVLLAGTDSPVQIVSKTIKPDAPTINSYFRELRYAVTDVANKILVTNDLLDLYVIRIDFKVNTRIAATMALIKTASTWNSTITTGSDEFSLSGFFEKTGEKNDTATVELMPYRTELVRKLKDLEITPAVLGDGAPKETACLSEEAVLAIDSVIFSLGSDAWE